MGRIATDGDRAGVPLGGARGRRVSRGTRGSRGNAGAIGPIGPFGHPEQLPGKSPVHHVNRVRMVPVGGNTEHRGLVDEQGGFVTDDQENKGDGAHHEAASRLLFFLPLRHNASD